MATRRPAGESEGDDEVVSATETASIVQRIRSSLGITENDSAKIKVYRANARRGGPLVWCADYTLEEFESGGEFEMIRSTWGPGDYDLRVFGGDGKNDRIVRSIASPYGMAPPMPPPTQAVNGDNSALAQVLAAIVDGQNRITEILSRAAPAPPDPLESIGKFAAVMATMRTAFAPPPTAPAPPAIDPVAQITQLLGAVRGVKDVAKELEGDGDKDNEPSLMTLAGSVIDLVKGSQQQNVQMPVNAISFPAIALPATIAAAHNSVQSIGESAPAIVAQTLAPPVESHQYAAPVSVQSNPIQSTESNDHMEALAKLVMSGIQRRITKMIADGKSPEEGGQYLYDKLPDDLLPYLELDNWFEVLSHFAPEFIAHREWMEKAKAHFDALLEADADEDSDSALPDDSADAAPPQSGGSPH